MGESGLPQPDLFIAALGRSGSTMIANLLTTPPHRWMMIEPRFADSSTGRDLLQQANEFGMPITPEEWQSRPGESESDRIERVFADRLAGLEKWGLKEVRPRLLAPTIEVFRPRSVMVLVRNLLDVAVSLVEKTEREQREGYDEEWVRGYLTDSPQAIVSLTDTLAGRPHRVVRYEDFVADPLERAAIRDWLDWPLSGDPTRHLAEIYGRSREVELHAGEVTSLALSRWESTRSERAKATAEWAASANHEFQALFGYA